MTGSRSIGRGSIVRSSIGKAVTAQKEVLFIPPRWRANPNVPIVLLSHGSFGDAYTWCGASSAWSKAKIISERYGLPCVAGDLDGAPAANGHGVGNDASQQAAISLVLWAQGFLGTKTGSGSVLGAGSSMGSHLMWVLHKNNPDLFRASAHLLVTSSVQRNYDVSLATDQTYHNWVDQAYSNVTGGWATAAPTHDPWVFKDQLLPLNLKVFLADTTDDTTSHADAVYDVNTMAAAVGAGAEVKFYGLGGHNIDMIDDDDVGRFLMRNSGLL